MMRGSRNRLSAPLWFALLAMGTGTILLAPGCEARDPNRALTNDEGEALLKSIRSHPPHPDDLTVAEKKWLMSRVGQ